MNSIKPFCFFDKVSQVLVLERQESITRGCPIEWWFIQTPEGILTQEANELLDQTIA